MEEILEIDDGEKETGKDKEDSSEIDEKDKEAGKDNEAGKVKETAGEVC